MRPVGARKAKLALFDLPIVGVAANYMPTGQILAVEQWHKAFEMARQCAGQRLGRGAFPPDPYDLPASARQSKLVH